MKRSLLCILICITPFAQAGFKEGWIAIEKKEWSTVYQEFAPLAKRGDPDAQVNIGNLYMKGYGVTQNYSSAFNWYLKAATQGHTIGQTKLGLMYYYGLGTPENHTDAAIWFTKAAKQGNQDAACLLGTLYETGDGVAKDTIQAYIWYTLSLNQGNLEATQSRDELVDAMSPGEIEEALTKLHEWYSTHPQTSTETVENKSEKKVRNGRTTQNGKHNPKN